MTPTAENDARCNWAANRLPHTAHGTCDGFMPYLAEELQRLMDHQARVIPPVKKDTITAENDAPTYTREDMARAWEQGVEAGFQFAVSHEERANPYRATRVIPPVKKDTIK
jgi:hypothetical protein